MNIGSFGKGASSVIFALAILLPTEGKANTMANQASGWGIDDWNLSTLNPVQYITTSTWLPLAQASSAFNTPNWTFGFTTGSMVPAGDFSYVDLAWVVINDPITDPNGIPHARPMMDSTTEADVGGEDFELIYRPNYASTSPNDPVNVVFLQMYQQSFCISSDDVTCTWWTDPTTHFDYVSGATTPLYIASGGIGGVIAGQPNATWMFDNPDDCENSNTPRVPGLNEGDSQSCIGGTDGTILASQVDFQTFIATDTVNGTNHTVTLYGGESWGYQYSNSDVPEPATFMLVGGNLIFIAFGGLWRVRQSSNSAKTSGLH
jgi:hypothetical protein